MSSEDRVAAVVWSVIVLALAAVIMVAIVQSQMTERAKFAAGYEQQVEKVEVVTQPMWRKK